MITNTWANRMPLVASELMALPGCGLILGAFDVTGLQSGSGGTSPVDVLGESGVAEIFDNELPRTAACLMWSVPS